MNIRKVNLSTVVDYDSYIALGNFDGVHIGHQKLIESVVNDARSFSVKSSVLIFREHTKNTIRGKKQDLLTSIDIKYRILEKMGIDIAYEMEFNENIMKLSPREFVKDFLIEKLKVKGIVVGFDYRFGYKAEGNIETLTALCNEFGLKLTVINAIYDDGEVISSTKIRNLIREGEIIKANKLLGRPFTISGKVIKGKGLGRTFGIPTANLSLVESFIIPKYGVYAGYAYVGNEKYKTAVNIGVNPTFDEDLRLEAFLIDFSGDLYDKTILIELVHYIRPEIKFSNIDDLVEKMNEDINFVKKII